MHAKRGGWLVGGEGVLYATVFDCPANAAFVSINLGRVDVAVAHLESIQASFIRLVAVSRLVNAKTHRWDGVTTVESEHFAAGSARH